MAEDGYLESLERKTRREERPFFASAESREQHMPMPRREFLGSTAALAAGASVAGGVRAAVSAEAGASAGTAVVVPPAPTSGLLFSCKYGMTKGGSLEERLTAARAAGMDGVDFDDAAAVTPEQLRIAAQQTGVFIHNAINHDHWKTRLTSPDDAVRKQALANLEHCLRVSAAAGGSGVLIVVGKSEDGPEGGARPADPV
jgi:L-ribulose-5-phosphate 3-epimerase